ncbi:unnamed protein product [Trifolium pratense]|uniref:Uncharacterized protein n=1 Tax=Trifolium pratense TaxID=57577 RepID=A0ACB0L4Q5_TRIPR|nr:unnamed protein product [Trifolium pratense]
MLARFNCFLLLIHLKLHRVAFTESSATGSKIMKALQHELSSDEREWKSADAKDDLSLSVWRL